MNKTASIRLHLHAQSGIEALPRFSGITARVCQDAGGTDPVIGRGVKMAMDPQVRSGLGDEPPHIRRESRVESVPIEGCWNGFRTRRMVGHNHDLPPLEVEQLILKPLPRLSMKLAGIAGPQTPIIWQRANPPIIIHPGLGHHLRNDGVAVQSKIRPEGRAKKGDPADRAAFIFQQTDVRAPSHFFEFGDELLEFLAIEFVVAQHVNHGAISKGLERPLQAVTSRADVPCKNDCVRLHGWRRERLKFEMQIAEEVEAHGTSMRADLDAPNQLRFLLNANRDTYESPNHFGVRRRVQGRLRGSK